MDRKGIAVTDTDAVIEKYLPEYFRLKVYSQSGPVIDFLNRMRDKLVATYLLEMQPKLVLTNLWSPEFIRSLFGDVGVKNGIFVFRANALDITRYSKKRGSALSTRLTAKWANSAEKWAPASFDTIIWLPTDCFLDDVVAPSKNGWVLTDLGREIAGKSRTEMLSFKFVRKEEKDGK